jgi:hypothetical protein
MDAGERTLVMVAATMWIAMGSYSAQISIVPTLWIYVVCGMAVATPSVAALSMPRTRRRERGRMMGRSLLLTAVLVSLLLARPGRRFSGGHTSDCIVATANQVDDAREAVAWVHTHIAREASPFTDTAVDTMKRGTARCGGMANLLDKIFKAKGVTSRIVHLEGDKGIHTLVEYRHPDGMWTLADPQENTVGSEHGGISGRDLLLPGGPPRGIPLSWQGHSRLYIYGYLSGYSRVTPENVHEYYGDASIER